MKDTLINRIVVALVSVIVACGIFIGGLFLAWSLL